MLKDVGIGGSVDVEMGEGANKRDPSKPYWNIKKVDMNSAKKGEDLGAPVEKVMDTNVVPLLKAIPNPQRVGLFIKLDVDFMELEMDYVNKISPMVL